MAIATKEKIGGQTNQGGRKGVAVHVVAVVIIGGCCF